MIAKEDLSSLLLLRRSSRIFYDIIDNLSSKIKKIIITLYPYINKYCNTQSNFETYLLCAIKQNHDIVFTYILKWDMDYKQIYPFYMFTILKHFDKNDNIDPFYKKYMVNETFISKITHVVNNVDNMYNLPHCNFDDTEYRPYKYVICQHKTTHHRWPSCFCNQKGGIDHDTKYYPVDINNLRLRDSGYMTIIYNVIKNIILKKSNTRYLKNFKCVPHRCIHADIRAILD